ncbi:unnamed protein product [Heterobilharzia americana]|nr:unnamed protein product [Heterobilharzia americana]
MESEISMAAKMLSLPQSLFLQPSFLHHDLANEYWVEKCSSHPGYSLLKPSEGEQWRPVSSFSPQVLRELHHLLAEWRSDARERVACMEEEERRHILASVGIQAFSEDAASRRFKHTSGNCSIKKSHKNSDVSITSDRVASWKSSNISSGMRKRKATQLIRGARSSKFGRPSTHPQNSSWSRKYCNKSVLKRRELPKTSSSSEKLKKSTHNDTIPQCLDEDEEEEEDQLTTIISRQRQAFSARAAAGRPSVRKTKSNTESRLVTTHFATVSCVPASRDFLLRSCGLGSLWLKR